MTKGRGGGSGGGVGGTGGFSLLISVWMISPGVQFLGAAMPDAHDISNTINGAGSPNIHILEDK